MKTIDDFRNEEARVSFLPVYSGDGYGFGGGTILTIGTLAINLGEAPFTRAIAKEIADRWNAAIAASEKYNVRN